MSKDRAVYDHGSVFHRQLGIFDPAKYPIAVHVVGAGAIGSYGALALAKIGFSDITVWDFDVVEPKNQPGQLYGLDDVGKPKVECLQRIVSELANIEIKTENRKWEGQQFEGGGIVISAVDCMDARKEIFKKIRLKSNFTILIDGRIGGQAVRLLAVRPMSMKDIDRYEKTLFTNEDAAELPCTERSVSDINFWVSGMIARQVRTFLTEGDMAFTPEVIFDALAGNMIKVGARVP